MGKKLTLAPRDAAKAPDAEKINSWLEAHPDAERLDADAFLVSISSGDIATQAEVYTGHDGEPLRYVRIELASAATPYGSALATEVRKLAAELASRFDLVVVTGEKRTDVADFFDAGGF